MVEETKAERDELCFQVHTEMTELRVEPKPDFWPDISVVFRDLGLKLRSKLLK